MLLVYCTITWSVKYTHVMTMLMYMHACMIMHSIKDIYHGMSSIINEYVTTVHYMDYHNYHQLLLHNCL